MKDNKLLAFIIGLIVVLIFGWGIQQRGKYFQELGENTRRDTSCYKDRVEIKQGILDLVMTDVNQLAMLADIHKLTALQTGKIVDNRRMVIDLVIENQELRADMVALRHRVELLELSNLIHARWHMRHSPFWSVLLDNAIRGYPVSEPPEISEPNEPECDLPGGG